MKHLNSNSRNNKGKTSDFDRVMKRKATSFFFTQQVKVDFDRPLGC